MFKTSVMDCPGVNGTGTLLLQSRRGSPSASSECFWAQNWQISCHPVNFVGHMLEAMARDRTANWNTGCEKWIFLSLFFFSPKEIDPSSALYVPCLQISDMVFSVCSLTSNHRRSKPFFYSKSLQLKKINSKLWFKNHEIRMWKALKLTFWNWQKASSNPQNQNEKKHWLTLNSDHSAS